MFIFPKTYDVIVVGGGHAGIEASMAAAKLGCQTLLLTMNPDTIAQMSCNPAIGGPGKGHMVHEIDALGGEMGKAADMAGLQFRTLNTKRGVAVQSTRVQCDKKAYQFRLKHRCECQENLEIKQAQTISIISNAGIAVGVQTSIGVSYLGRTVVIATGTFLHGLMHVGSSQASGGRSGESAATGLSASLAGIGLELGRLKTGTPPRLLKRSVDFSKTQEQPGCDPVPYFTFWKDELFHMEHFRGSLGLAGSPMGVFPRGSVLESIGGQLPCFITYTTQKTADVVRSNISKSPLYAGIIKGIGPRYCPSIEDKVIRFSEKERHQIFLEPEGISTEEIYVNGFSTSLPYEVQLELVSSIIGCENAQIIRPAYAVEYDFVFPTQLKPNLETKACANLFLAGQINGTSGYEEAAAQGLIAGINAAMVVLGRESVVLRRDQAYIGVLIDDLVTKGTSEPYRMFTSRAEYRLLLREDNADLRLSELGHQIGLLPKHNYETFRTKQQKVAAEIERLHRVRFGTSTLAQLLKRPEVSYHSLPHQETSLSKEVTSQVEISIKYEGYIRRQEAEARRARSHDDKQIPASFDFATVPSLRTEARQKLIQIRPSTLGQASRISGVSPADISLLTVWLGRAALAESRVTAASLEDGCLHDDDSEG